MAINWTPTRLEIDVNYKTKDTVTASDWNNLWKETRLQGNNNTNGIELLISTVDDNIAHLSQIDAALAQIKGSQGQGNAAQIDAQTEQNNQMLLKALENPDGFVRLLEAATKAQNLGKNNKPRR